MKVRTLLFGDIEIGDEYKIEFVSPILGFEDEREFVLIREKDDSPFFWLQSLKTPELAFLLADPFIFFPDYSINIEDSHIGEKIAIYVIVALNEDFKLSTANLIAPIVIDIESKKAFQIVLEDSPYTTRHYLFEDEISNSALVG
ncbi:MAG TPA: flagellar assembly protein FliW [bacterium]|jgi:flagellar assembly factor FliW|nr:flagellar assembly protein FliW [Dictyoglomota bacterium]HHV80881.1 flagellar assembly protein FliW [bacterium]HOP55881.1 flagellar assembly protein FliW [bacterium]